MPVNNIMSKNDPKYVDLLDEDRSIAGQKFVCLSFISPEKIVKQKSQYFFNEFVKQWDFSKSMEKYTQFLNFLSYKYSMNFDKLTEDLKDFVNEERDALSNATIEDEYKNFLDINEDRLDAKFNETNNFQTSTRGIKVRGSFPNVQEAELRCKMLRELDPSHDVYVGEVGIWMPFHPEAYKTGRVEYLEEELNQLMSEKQKNENSAKIAFEQRVKDSKEKAMEDNKKKALASGNKLTQTINKDGELVSIKNMNTSELSMLHNSANDEIAVADIRKELFEGDNIVIDYKNDDHGLNKLLAKEDESKSSSGDMEEID